MKRKAEDDLLDLLMSDLTNEDVNKYKNGHSRDGSIKQLKVALLEDWSSAMTRESLPSLENPAVVQYPRSDERFRPISLRLCTNVKAGDLYPTADHCSGHSGGSSSKDLDFTIDFSMVHVRNRNTGADICRFSLLPKDPVFFLQLPFLVTMERHVYRITQPLATAFLGLAHTRIGPTHSLPRLADSSMEFILRLAGALFSLKKNNCSCLY